MEKYKNLEHVCQFGRSDCIKHYDIRTFHTVCCCEDLESQRDMFSKLFVNKYFLNEKQLQNLSNKVYEDSKKIYSQKLEQNIQQTQITQLKELRESHQQYIDKLNSTWINISDIEPQMSNQIANDQSIQDIESLYQEVVSSSKDFSECNLESLFKATENNKLMQKCGTGIAGKYQKKNSNKNENLLNELRKLQQATEQLSLQLSQFINSYQIKGGSDEVYNFDYTSIPFLNIDPESLN